MRGGSGGGGGGGGMGSRETERERGRGEKEREEGREGSADLLFSNPATEKPPLHRPVAHSLTLGLPLHQCVTLQLRV